MIAEELRAVLATEELFKGDSRYVLQIDLHLLMFLTSQFFMI